MNTGSLRKYQTMALKVYNNQPIRSNQTQAGIGLTRGGGLLKGNLQKEDTILVAYLIPSSTA
jgi:hypothetical protein